VDFSFTDDQLQFRDAVRTLLDDRCPPAAVRSAWTNETGRIEGLWARLADMGVLGLMAPEERGGLGMGEVDLVLLLEEAGRAAVPDPLLEHTAVAIPTLSDAGVCADVVDAAVSGAVTVTVGLADAGPYVLGAEQADHLLLERHASLHLVDAAAATITPVSSVDDSRRLGRVEFALDDAQLVSDDPRARSLAFDRGALGAAAQCVGVAQQLLDVTVAYVAERHQFGRPVGANQAVKHHLANVALAIEFARPMVYEAAWCIATGAEHRSREVSVAKAMASDAVDLACRRALQCHGAIGYTIEYDLQLWLKRGWALAAAWGDSRRHRRRVAAALQLA